MSSENRLNYVLNVLIMLICFSIWDKMGYMRVLDYATIVFIFVFALADTGFYVLFVVACHKKSHKLLNIFLIYNIVATGLYTLSYSVKIYDCVDFLVNGMHFCTEICMITLIDLLVTVALTLGTIAVQIYLNLLIYNEMVKLKNQTLEIEMQSSNHLLHAATDQREERTMQCMGGNYGDNSDI